MKKPKTVELTLRVRVPKGMSAAHTKREVANAWYGEIYAMTQDGRDVTLKPRFSKARVVVA